MGIEGSSSYAIYGHWEASVNCSEFQSELKEPQKPNLGHKLHLVGRMLGQVVTWKS